ncbi:MAG: glycosyltransferase family 4 protein [Solirubrobacteraceae bacterium]
MNDQNDGLPAYLGHEQRNDDVAYLRAPKPRAAIVVGQRDGNRLAADLALQVRRHGVPGYRAEVLAPEELTDNPDFDLIADYETPTVHNPTVILSPTRAADQALANLGVDPGRIARWEPGIDRKRFGPAHFSASAIPAPREPASPPFNVLCTDSLDDDRRVALLLSAFEVARRRCPGLQLVVTDCGRAAPHLRSDLRGSLTLLEPADEQRAPIYASADLFVTVDAGNGFGAGVLEAQTSGLPVLALEGSGPAELIEPGRNGCVVAPDPDTLGAAIRGLARRATLRERLVTGSLLSARERTWERSLMDLASCWDRALGASHARGHEVTRAA